MARKGIKKRMSEPSTWAGFTGIIMGLGSLFKINEAPEIAAVAAEVGGSVIMGTNPITAGLMALTGLMAVFMKEKGDS